MGQTKKQRIAELEQQLDNAHDLNANLAREHRVARADLNAYRAEESRQKALAARAKREAEREAEYKRRDDLSNGIVDLSKIRHDLGFDYDHDAGGGTVTITLHANATEAKILNAYATRDRVTSGARAAGAVFDELNRITEKWLGSIVR